MRRSRSAAFPPTMTEGAWIWAEMIVGMIEASAKSVTGPDHQGVGQKGLNPGLPNRSS